MSDQCPNPVTCPFTDGVEPHPVSDHPGRGSARSERMDDRLREALETVNRATQVKMLVEYEHKAVTTVMAAARRFLALTETGPDYEAAFDHYLTETGSCRQRAMEGAVDAAFAHYLTEEGP